MLGIRGFNVKKCRICGHETVASVYIRGYGYICSKHLNLYPYTWRNEIMRGTGTNRDFTWGIELEFRRHHERDTQQRIELFGRLAARGFVPTEDGTIDDTEWKSPIYLSRRALISSLKPLMQIYQAYFRWYLVSSHVHVGRIPYSNYQRIEMVLPELSDVYIDERLWGRGPNDYCHLDNPDDRYYFINLKTANKGDVEFRLPKITTYRQLLLVTLFIKRFIKQPERFEKIQEEMVKRI